MDKEKYLKYCLYALLCFLILSILLLSYVPPISRDALTHHLAVPKLYIQHGGIYEIPSIRFSYYPMNLELLYMIPMYFGNDIIPKWIHFVFALATAYLIYRYLKKRLNSIYGLFGSLLLLSIPIIVKLSITAYVDLGLVFFSTASMILLIGWTEKDCPLRYLVYSAVCCGLALGTKYNGLVVLFILTLFVPIIYIRSREDDEKENKSLLKQLKALKYGVIYFVVALIVFSPWMLRNYIWKKNPIYPLYHTIFTSIAKPLNTDSRKIQKTRGESGKLGHVLNKRKKQWNHFEIRRFIYKETWWQIFIIPLRVFFQGKDGDPRYFDGQLNPFLLFLPILYFVIRKKNSTYERREADFFLAFSITFFLYVFISEDMRIRYIAPIIPLLVILSVFGFKQTKEFITAKIPVKQKKYVNYFLVLIVSLIMLLNVFYFVQQFRYVLPFAYLSGKISRDEYITKFRAEYPVYQYANKKLPKQSKLLGVFMGNRRYYCERDIVFNNRLLSETIKATDNPQLILNRLKSKSISHIIIWERYFAQWAVINLNKDNIASMKLFFKSHTRLLFTSGGYGLYALDDSRKE